MYFIIIKLKQTANLSGGLRSCGIAGLIGFSLTTIYSFISSRIKKFEDIRENIIHFKN